MCSDGRWETKRRECVRARVPVRVCARTCPSVRVCVCPYVCACVCVDMRPVTNAFPGPHLVTFWVTGTPFGYILGVQASRI